MRTSSPGTSPMTSSASCKAAVPEFTANACLHPIYAAKLRSNSCATGPVVSHPDASTFWTASISSGPMEARWKGIKGTLVMTLLTWEIGELLTDVERAPAAVLRHLGPSLGRYPEVALPVVIPPGTIMAVNVTQSPYFGTGHVLWHHGLQYRDEAMHISRFNRTGEFIQPVLDFAEAMLATIQHADLAVRRRL